MIALIAHRGASKEAPENTLIALRKALEIGVDFIEVDVHLSRDGVPIVIHDAILGRTSNIRHLERIIDLDLMLIREIDVGLWFKKEFAEEKIPTLDEVLQLERGDTGLMLEIKRGHSQIQPLVSSVIKSIDQHGGYNVIVGSFSIQILEEIKRQNPGFPLIGIVEELNMLDHMRALKLSRLAIWYKLLTPQLIENLHAEGVDVWTFTVDDKRTVEFLKFIGVDGIITNDPRRMRKLLK